MENKQTDDMEFDQEKEFEQKIADPDFELLN